MDYFQQTIQDIKTIKIQGANNIALAAARAFDKKLREQKWSLDEMNELQRQLSVARTTEPALRNALEYIKLYHLDRNPLAEIETMFKQAQEKINLFTYELLHEISTRNKNTTETPLTVFTVCHSSTVIKAVIFARDHGIPLQVKNAETRPLYQGRKTAQDMDDAGIKTQMYTDNAARNAIKESDVFLFGADAIDKDGDVYNKIGTGMFAEIAQDENLPAYAMTNSWKLDLDQGFGEDTVIEQRDGREVWVENFEHVEVENFAFEKVERHNITGIITELGILKPTEVFHRFNEEYFVK